MKMVWAALVAMLMVGMLSTAVQSQSAEMCVTDPAGDGGTVGDNEDRPVWDLTEVCVESVEGLVTFTFIGEDRDGFLTHLEADGTTTVQQGWNQNSWGECDSFDERIGSEQVDGGVRYAIVSSCFPEGDHTLTFRTFWQDDYGIRYEGDAVDPVHFNVLHGEPPEGIYEPAPITRLAGGSRYETAVEVSRFQFPNGAGRVTLANANVQVDALPGSQLGGGPILYVPAEGEVPQVVLDEVARLNPREVIVLGGALAVTDDVAAQVQAQTSHRVN